MSGTRADGGGPDALDRRMEVALTGGLLVSAALLMGGLLTASTAPLRWGILVLVATPVARVVVMTVGLLRRRDWAFALISLWILGVLASSALVAVRMARPGLATVEGRR